ncbi:hemin uptake protein HemP [Elioraea sp. Yellowstone]|uniref:hemin uptake protein HemP n=1 Tax=Elioraea sp. Yellowstone TaxID=2592070 RepID=UPI0011519B3D|nr:hemin uptake protein HemP [Elioraea sp. Yellowstone]TQF76580.1 hemin uptake protein HemP [Elioraea sp. Yellowstone]
MPETDQRADAETPPKPRLSSRELLGTRQEVEIEHQGEIYRLRITRAGKLILTK